MSDPASRLHPLQQLSLGQVRAALRMVCERVDLYLWRNPMGMTPQQAASALGLYGGDLLAVQAAAQKLLAEVFPSTAAQLTTANRSAALVTVNADGTLAIGAASATGSASAAAADPQATPQNASGAAPTAQGSSGYPGATDATTAKSAG